MKKGIFLFALAVLIATIFSLFTNQIYASDFYRKNEPKIYEFGKEPKISGRIKYLRTYPTLNLTKTPFFIRITSLETKNIQMSSKYFGYSGNYKSEQGTKNYYFRIFITNTRPKPFKNLTFIIQYFIYDLPYNQTREGKTHVRKTSERIKEYTTISFFIEEIPKEKQIVIDTPVVELEYSERKFVDDVYDRTHPYYDDTYCSLSGYHYAGAIISIFDQNGNLLYQQTDNKRLKKMGIKKLSQ